MKIALVGPYDFAYPSGVANHISALERHLTRLGQDVKIIAPASRLISGHDHCFIPIGRPHPIPANGSLARVTLSLTLGPRVKEVLGQEKFDIVHLHEPLMPMLCIAVLLASNTTTIGTFHATYKGPRFIPGKPFDGYNFGRPLTTLILKRWARILDGRIAVSKIALDFAARYFPAEYKIIPNGIDLEHFTPDVSPVPEFCDGKLNILFVGRLEKRKGFRYLLNAYRQVKEQLPNCRLIVVGPGTQLRRKYEKQVADEAIADVVFVGFVSYEDLPKYYRTADVFCAPATHSESFGIVLLEAMSVGKPILASEIDGYAGIMKDGAEGLLVPPRDDQALARALLGLLKDKALRDAMGRRGRETAQEYRWDSVARKVLDYYTSVLESGPQRRRNGKKPGFPLK